MCSVMWNFLIILALLSKNVVTSSFAPEADDTIEFTDDTFNLDGPCDETFPQAPLTHPSPLDNDHHNNHQRRLVAIPDDPKRQSYAPLCPDGHHIDLRRMQTCYQGQCYVEKYQGCFHATSQECLAVLNNPALNTNLGANGVTTIGVNSGLGLFALTNNNGLDANGVVATTEEAARQNQVNVVVQTCQPGQCFVHMYQTCMHITSQECMNPQPTQHPTPRPIVRPTPRPTFAIETTVHPVAIVLENIACDYILSDEARAVVLRYVKQNIEDFLDPQLQFIELEFAGYTRRDRRLLPSSSSSIVRSRNTQCLSENLSVSMAVTVKGRSNLSDIALSFVMDAVKASMQDLVSELKSLEWETFKNVVVDAETFDPNVIQEIITRRPTRRPTPAPTPRPVSSIKEEVFPIQLVFKNVDLNYRLSAYDRASIIRKVREIIELDLSDSLALMDVEFAGGNLPYLPMTVKVRGPEDDLDFALMYLMDLFQTHMPDIVKHVKTVDFDEFRDVELSVESYDPDYLPVVVEEMIETDHSVKLVVKGLPDNYRLSNKERDDIIDRVEDLIRDDLDDFELVGVSFAGTRVQYINNGFLLHLRVTTKGPGCSTYIIMEMIEDDIGSILSPLDAVAIEDARVSVDTYETEELSYIEVDHHVQLTVKGVDEDYRLSNKDRGDLVRYAENMLEDKLEDDSKLTLVEVSFTGTKVQYINNGFSLPLKVTTRGPAGYAAEVIVLEIIQDDRDNIEDVLKDIDDVAFEDARVSADIYDPEELSYIEVDHHVELIVKGVDEDYRLSNKDRGDLVSYAENMLEDKLEDDSKLTLVKVSFAGTKVQYTSNGFSLPLKVTTRGPAGYAAEDIVLEIIQDDGDNIEAVLKDIDGVAFKDARVSADIYDPEELSYIEVETYVELTIDSVDGDYRLSNKERDDLVSYVENMLEEDLEEGVELVKVSFAGTEIQYTKNSFSVPMIVTTRGPKDSFSDRALSSAEDAIMSTIEDGMDGIADFLQTLDDTAFENAELSVEAFDPEELSQILTDHPVQLIIKNAPDLYRLSDKDRDSIVRYVENLIEDNLEEELELIGAPFAGRKIQYWSNTFWLPMRVTIKGPPDVSEFALSYIMEIVRDGMDGIEDFLQTLDYDTFRKTNSSAGTYDFDDLMNEITEHQVALVFKDLPMGARFNDKVRTSIVRYVQDIIAEYLDTAFLLLEARYGGRIIMYGKNRLLQYTDTKYLPISVAVKGPADMRDFATSYVMEAIEDRTPQIESYVRSLDQEFTNVQLDVKMYDLDDVMDKVTENPVQLIFANLPAGSSISQTDRDYIISFVENRLEDNLPDLLELIDVSYAGRLNQYGTRMLQNQANTPLLATLIRIQGPSDVSDFVLPFILQAIGDSTQALEDYLSTVNREVYKNAEVSVDSYNMDDIDATYDPPPRNNSGVLDEEKEPLPGWVWVLVTILILFVCCCCIWTCCCFAYKYKQRKDVSIEKEVIIETKVEEEVVEEKKKHRKKRKKTRSREIQVGSEDRSPENGMVFVPYNANGLVPYGGDIAVESAVTMFKLDPPENSVCLQLEADPSYTAHLALPPPTEEPLLLCADHSTHHHGVQSHTTRSRSHRSHRSRAGSRRTRASRANASHSHGVYVSTDASQVHSAITMPENDPQGNALVLVGSEEPAGVYDYGGSVAGGSLAQSYAQAYTVLANHQLEQLEPDTESLATRSHHQLEPSMAGGSVAQSYAQSDYASYPHHQLEPSLAGGSVAQSYAQSNYASQPHNQQEPSLAGGSHAFSHDAQSYHQEEPTGSSIAGDSHAHSNAMSLDTQSPPQNETTGRKARKSSVFATFNDPSFWNTASVDGDDYEDDPVKGASMYDRRNRGRVWSDDDSSNPSKTHPPMHPHSFA